MGRGEGFSLGESDFLTQKPGAAPLGPSWTGVREGDALEGSAPRSAGEQERTIVGQSGREVRNRKAHGRGDERRARGVDE